MDRDNRKFIFLILKQHCMKKHVRNLTDVLYEQMSKEFRITGEYDVNEALMLLFSVEFALILIKYSVDNINVI